MTYQHVYAKNRSIGLLPKTKKKRKINMSVEHKILNFQYYINQRLRQLSGQTMGVELDPEGDI